MKLLFSCLFTLTLLSSSGQNIYFPAKDLADSNNYVQAMSHIASDIISAYTNADRAGYYNDLFRFQFAKKDYRSVIQSLDSFDVNAKMDKQYYKISGFHYRMHSMTMLAVQSDPSKDYANTYAGIFNTVYSSLPEAGKDQVNSIYQKADADGEKQKFINLIKQYRDAGKDSISLTNAVELTKQWNYWQVYSKTVALAKKEIATIETLESVKKQNELMGFEDGASLSPNSKIFIKNVTLVDVEKQKLVPNAMVGITGNSITSINTNSKNTFPADAVIIDGTGKFLMPGMTDAHIHFFQSGGLYTRPDAMDLRKDMPYEKEIEWTKLNMKDALKRYIQCGITSVFDVGSSTSFLELRNKFSNKSYAPAVYITGPLLTSYEPDVFKKLGDNEPFSLVATEAEGRKMVQQQLPHHPDFIKIWYIANGNDKEAAAKKFLPVAKAIIDEAHKNNLKVAVHATERITAQFAVEAGCDFLVHSVEDEIVSDDFLKLLKTKNVTLCPTLVVYGGYRKTFGQLHDFSTSELNMSNPVQLGSLFDLKHLPERSMIDAYKSSVRNNAAVYNHQDSICLVNLKKMIDAGIRIAAGTDAGNIGTLHATSYLNELKEMKKSGISNWQVIRSATLDPQYIFGREKQTGSIATGKTADLVLLNANPVDDLQNLQQVNLVINKGFLIRPDTLIKETPLSLVQKQLNAYNARNLDAFLEPYAEDVELYNFPSTLLAKGKEEMRKQYAFFATVPELHCEIKGRIIQGNIIIDKESVTGFGSKAVEATAIYHIENGKIKKVYFISNR